MNGEELLAKWNDLLTSIIKNWKEIISFILTVTFLSKGLLTGSMFGGLAKLMQSLTVSAGNLAATMQTMGTNLYNSPIMGLLPRTIAAGGGLIGKGLAPVGQGLGKAAAWAGNGIASMGSGIASMGQGVGNFVRNIGSNISGNYSSFMSRVT